ncbi:hypothetical protein FISHEDRAFT_60224 [Fistulina hepatica ATCC 64428]|uniref:t-SNARE coiled-coil homology domain-containing protein n=1 Tax=Fistulina hepatica ATCC 64428 TaxID=1128425 RepID=A0A0D7A8D0_9AGAR|nr:hypothetical protein FISHEDRAFT_60224 [Fistulina hepatica ATCC 64428]
MAFSSRTEELRDAAREKVKSLPENKRRKLSKHTRSISADAQLALDKEFMKEAYTILKHIDTLTRMFAIIRKPYLNVDARPNPLGGISPRNLDIGGESGSWSDIRYLSNEERDQIDVQTRVILTRCADRVKQMEELEKRRSEAIAGKANPLTRLLPARLRQNETTMLNDFIAAHHAGVTWYLNRRLAKASQVQKEMQEERVKRQLERTRTLGSGAAREAEVMGISDSLYPRVSSQRTDAANASSSWLGAPTSFLAATIGASSSPTPPIHVPSGDVSSLSDDDDDDIELSASQIQQFETENANILRSVQETLESVQQAESRLMDISALQVELVNHLTKQTELTDQLYEDAIATTSTVEKGNVQLREARRRAKDGRLFILIFLIGASLSLLFLHYY